MAVAERRMKSSLHCSTAAHRSARSWLDASSWATRTAAEIADLDQRSLVRDRKLLKLIRRSDALGIYAASQALDSSVLPAWRD